MSMLFEKKVLTLEDEVRDLKREVASLRAALELADEVDTRRKPGRPRREETQGQRA